MQSCWESLRHALGRRRVMCVHASEGNPLMENRWDVPRSLICTPNNFSITCVGLLNNSRRQKERRPAGGRQTRHTSRSSAQDTTPQTPLFMAGRDELDAGQVIVKWPNACGWRKKAALTFVRPFIDWRRASKELRGTTLDYWVFIHDAAPVRGAFVPLSAGKLCFSVKRCKSFCLSEKGRFESFHDGFFRRTPKRAK